MKTIQHGIDDKNAHCRSCGFSEDTGDVLKKAKKHSRETKHTVDIYYETWREVTYNWRTRK